MLVEGAGGGHGSQFSNGSPGGSGGGAANNLALTEQGEELVVGNKALGDKQLVVME